MAASVLEPRPSTAVALSGSGVTGSRQHFGQAGLRLVERGRLVVLCFTLWVTLAWRQGSGLHRGRYTARWAKNTGVGCHAFISTFTAYQAQVMETIIVF